MDYYKLINDIDYINTQSIVSEMHVIEALSNTYNKESCILEYNSDVNTQYLIIQEGEVLDKVKKESKNDKNKLITIIKFIPRLIKAFIETLKPNKKKKGKFEKVKDNLKKFDSLPKAKKEQKVAELNERFKGQHEFYIDEKTGKIKIKKSIKDIGVMIGNAYCLFTNTRNLVKEMKEQLDPLNPGSVNKFVDKCDNIIHIHENGREIPVTEIVNTIESGISGTSDVVSICSKIAAEIVSIISTLNIVSDKILTHEVVKDMPNEKVVKLTEGLSKLTAKISKINLIVSLTVGKIDKVVDMFNTVSDIAMPKIKKKTLHKEMSNTIAADEAFEKFGDFDNPEAQDLIRKRKDEIYSDLVKKDIEEQEKKEKETKEKIKMTKNLNKYIKNARSLSEYDGTNEKNCLDDILGEEVFAKNITSEYKDSLLALYDEQHKSNKK